MYEDNFCIAHHYNVLFSACEVVGDTHELRMELFLRKGINIEEVEGCPDGEEVEEKSVVIEMQGYARGFLLMNLIEYALAKKGIAVLEAYLKRSRIPQAKKYAKDVMNFAGFAHKQP